MRILLTTTAGVGHLHPLVPLARAAGAAGHEVRIAAPRSLGPALVARGLPHLPLPDYGPDHLARVEDVMRRLGPPGSGAEVPMFREVFGWAKTDSTLDAMRRAVADWRPDLLLHEAAELSGPFAAEAGGVAHAMVATALRRTLAMVLPYVAEGAADLAVWMGLPPDREGRRLLDAPYVTLVPPSLEEPGTGMPDEVLRYRLTDLHGGEPGPALAGAGPLVWIALGTETWRIPGLLPRIAPLLRATATALPHVRFLLTTGAPDVPVPAMPANVQVEPYVPQEAVLDRCALVLGHGGFNTTMAALSRGVPLVVMPLFASDQFDNAARLATVGAAVAVTDPSPEDLAQAVERALTDPGIASAAHALAEEMAALPSAGQALDGLLAGVTAHA